MVQCQIAFALGTEEPSGHHVTETLLLLAKIKKNDVVNLPKTLLHIC